MEWVGDAARNEPTQYLLNKVAQAPSMRTDDPSYLMTLFPSSGCNSPQFNTISLDEATVNRRETGNIPRDPSVREDEENRPNKKKQRVDLELRLGHSASKSDNQRAYLPRSSLSNILYHGQTSSPETIENSSENEMGSLNPTSTKRTLQ
ncbi:hypothetical protein PGT21_008080 [Puccinia graminis f. sp. tritici]|uniref:Uncharacterized protein n=1 Tax=Puccinia graminis f. sp. tritici TaxID=56615 RepID=A0A5B0MDE2_PUCGR|nr:hypothetical protein PGTUg99_025832 [Puccinia graminis f. sp. tritici]KAA1090634.1 hypothetical protein PGT21_008080 [Puccinia graminis f. sp. tritici]